MMAHPSYAHMARQVAPSWTKRLPGLWPIKPNRVGLWLEAFLVPTASPIQQVLAPREPAAQLVQTPLATTDLVEIEASEMIKNRVLSILDYSSIVAERECYEWTQVLC